MWELVGNLVEVLVISPVGAAVNMSVELSVQAMNLSLCSLRHGGVGLVVPFL